MHRRSSEIAAKVTVEAMAHAETQEPPDRLAEGDDRESHNFTLAGKTYTRKKRRPLNRLKKERLEEAFQRKEVPRGRHGSAAKKRLAKELDMTVKEVHKWFDNRRTKESLLEKRLFSRMTGKARRG